MLLGHAAEPSAFSAEQPGAPAPPTGTRRQDKVLTMKTASMKALDGPPDKPALTLAKAFDSYEATMRLAAMTGMDKELAGFADTAPRQTAGAGSPGFSSAPARDNARSERSARGTRVHRSGYTWLWIVSVVALVAALRCCISISADLPCFVTWFVSGCGHESPTCSPPLDPPHRDHASPRSAWALARGISACVNYSLAASRNRSWPR
jgi:hypothetical protein